MTNIIFKFNIGTVLAIIYLIWFFVSLLRWLSEEPAPGVVTGNELACFVLTYPWSFVFSELVERFFKIPWIQNYTLYKVCIYTFGALINASILHFFGALATHAIKIFHSSKVIN